MEPFTQLLAVLLGNLTGFTTSGDGDINCPYNSQRCWVLKIDAAGTLQWNMGPGGAFSL